MASDYAQANAKKKSLGLHYSHFQKSTAALPTTYEIKTPKNRPFRGRIAEGRLALQALAQALKGLKVGPRPIHHSDRGCQYASHAYVRAAQRAGLRLSMTEQNHSAENALAERVNGILKQEYYLDQEFEGKGTARQAIKQSVYLYNTRRPHCELGLATPEQKHRGGV